MIPINVRTNIRDYTRRLDRLARDQVPFATAVALIRTAQDAQEEVRKQLKRRFTIRRAWVPSGIRITPARKTDLEASVGSRDHFMALQETGGIKRPRTAAHIAVPANVRRSKSGVVTKANRPRALLAKPGHFRTERAIMKRGRGKGARPVRLFTLARSARIRPRFGFKKTTARVAAVRLPKSFGAALARALASSRRR